MMMSLCKYFFIFILALGCKNLQTNNLNSVEQTLSVKESTAFDVQIGYRNLYLTSPIEKKIDSQKTVNEDIWLNCKGWTLTSESIRNLLYDMRIVEATEWYALCYQYPVWYEGIVKNDHSEFRIIINAASFVILTNNDETLHFILERESKLFLAACDCCE